MDAVALQEGERKFPLLCLACPVGRIWNRFDD
jgi:hypothetical protein